MAFGGKPDHLIMTKESGQFNNDQGKWTLRW